MIDYNYLKGVSTLKLDADKCTGCGMCVNVCPHAVMDLSRDNGSKKVHIAQIDKCMECGACMTNCPVEALSVDKGVGCAAGVINGFLLGTEPTCGCSDEGGACC